MTLVETDWLSENLSKVKIFDASWHLPNSNRNAFNEFKSIGNVKKHLNLQIDCGIIELFESLIDDPQVNFKNRKRIMDICRDWNVLNSTNTLEEFFV